MKQRVNWTVDERVDIPDIKAMQTLGETQAQADLRVVADVAPVLGSASGGLADDCRGSVIGTADPESAAIAYDVGAGTAIVRAGLVLVLSAVATTGEAMTVDSDTPVDGACPGVVTPHRWLGARCATSLVASVEEDRQFYNSVTHKEKTLPVMTRETRGIEFVSCDADDAAAVTAQEQAGYQRVAYLDYNGGTRTFTLATLFPNGQGGGGTKFPNGYTLRSVVQVLWAFATRIAEIIGYSQWWSTLPTTPYGASASLLGLVSGMTTQKAVLDDHETRIGDLEDATSNALACFVTKITQDVTGGTQEDVTWPTDERDTASPGWHDPVTNNERIDPQQAGVFHVGVVLPCTIDYEALASGFVILGLDIRLRADDSVVTTYSKNFGTQFAGGVGSAVDLDASWDVYLTAAQYLVLTAYAGWTTGGPGGYKTLTIGAGRMTVVKAR